MAVTNIELQSGPYLPNGVTTVFGYAFRAFSKAEITVYRGVIGGWVMVNPALYDVTVAAAEGGTVVFATPPSASGGPLYIVGSPDFRQATAFSSGEAPFSPRAINSELDRAALRSAALLDGVGRALTVPRGEQGGDLPPASVRAGGVLVFSALDGTAGVAPIGSFPAGPPGGNIMAISLFANAGNLNIPAGTNRVRVEGNTVRGFGAADYIEDVAIVAPSAYAFVSKNGRGFRLAPDQQLTFPMFGARPEYVSPVNRGADNYPAYLAFRAFATAYGLARSTFYRMGPTLYVPLGDYYMSDAFDLDFATVSIVGERTGATDSDGLGGSTLVFAEGKPGIIIESADTKGEGSRPIAPGSTGSLIDGITVRSLGGAVGAAADGFRCRGQFSIYNCVAIGFPRHGFNLSASLSGQGGNINSSFMQNCTAVRNYLDGFYFQGADANAISCYHLNGLYNGRCGINFDQFLACSLFGYHLEGNGTNDAGPRTMPQQPGAQCYHAGRYYNVYPARAADASNSTPGVVPEIWVDRGAGAPHPLFPTYVIGQPWSEGSAMRIVGANAQTVVIGGYIEPGQPALFVGGGGMQLGGQQDAGVIGSKAYLYVSSGMFTAPAFQISSGTETTQLGGEPETRLFQRSRTSGFFPWNATGNASGDYLFGGGNTGGNVWSARQTDNRMRIVKPLLASLRVENSTAPVATGAVVRTVELFDGNDNSLGVLEVKAKA